MARKDKGPFGYWKWQDGSDRYEVWLHRGSLIWNWQGPRDLGGDASQSFEDFFARGPLEKGVPGAILAEIQAAMAARGITPDSVAAQARKKRAAEPDRSPAASTTQPTSLPRTLLVGLVIILGGSTLAAGLALALPFWGAFSAALPLIAGFAALALGGGATVVIAGLLGLASALVCALAAPLALSAVAPEPAAFPPGAQLRRDLAGTYDFTTHRISGGSRIEQRNRAHAAPFLGAGVPAGNADVWVVCTTTPGFNCLRADKPAALRPAREEDRAAYLAAIQSAQKAHRLAVSANPAIYETADPGMARGLALLTPLVAAALFAGVAVIFYRRDQRGGSVA